MKFLKKFFALLSFLAFYLREVILSNLKVAHDVLTPTDYSSPAIIAFPLTAKSDLEILVLANLISMTPGTLSMDVSTDRRTLYIHGMFVNDPEALKRELATTIEARVLKLFR
jgi:multicomponent Na+:H+ antiporter subunit E